MHGHDMMWAHADGETQRTDCVALTERMTHHRLDVGLGRTWESDMGTAEVILLTRKFRHKKDIGKARADTVLLAITNLCGSDMYGSSGRCTEVVTTLRANCNRKHSKWGIV